MQHFLWRLAYNSLPHRWSIQRRGVDLDPLCPVCQRLNKDGAHPFLHCKDVRAVWQRMELEHVRQELAQLTMSREVVQAILTQTKNAKSVVWFCCGYGGILATREMLVS